MSINKVMATGNLTRDPELRATPAGTQVLRFGIAVNDRARNQQTGEWEDRPNFVDCVIFGARAEAMDRILAKGMKVAVEGRLRYSSWQDKEGNRRSKLEVVVDDIDLMSARAAARQPAQGASQAYAASAPQGRPQPARAAQTPPAADIYDEDIPF
ncbi:single-stranded DNA-binding protein [Olsenella uli]|uniref:single-stranded DNA-binding protein n=1 Tax=Olsenella uli TaxID=133926 RepID=UPI003D79721E